jgi:hypothetical protein
LGYSSNSAEAVWYTTVASSDYKKAYVAGETKQVPTGVTARPNTILAMVGAYNLDNNAWLWHKIIQADNNEQLGIEILTINNDNTQLFGIGKKYNSDDNVFLYFMYASSGALIYPIK